MCIKEIILEVEAEIKKQKFVKEVLRDVNTDIKRKKLDARMVWGLARQPGMKKYFDEMEVATGQFLKPEISDEVKTLLAGLSTTQFAALEIIIAEYIAKKKSYLDEKK
jgi:hypothetical protein